MRGAMAELWKRSVVRALVAEVGCGLLETLRRRGWGGEERRNVRKACLQDGLAWMDGPLGVEVLVAWLH